MRPGGRGAAIGFALLATVLLAGSQTAGSASAQAARPRSCHAPEGQVKIPAGDVLLGEDGAGSPGRRERVEAFWIDRHEVTNAQFAAFVAATGYVTDAERQGGGAVFQQPDAVDGLDDARQWWRWVRGASWRHPTGPSSQIAERMEDPVVQVTYADAAAYARWAGADLPSVAQWERAARGDQRGPVAQIAWAYDEAGRPRANTWQGDFPVRNTARDGFHGLASVGCFQPNAFGLFDMIGNAWEWTRDTRGGVSERVVKGGSFLCSANYCANFRPAGWQAQEADLPTSHIGFRTVRLRAPNAE